MLKKFFSQNLTFAEAKLACDVSDRPGAIAEMLEQDNGLWTVTLVYDDGKPEAAAAAAAAPASAPASAPSTLATRDTTLNLVEKSNPPLPPSSGMPLGILSSRFESNGMPGAIGFDSTGGFSYGTYQIATKTGTMAKFLAFLNGSFPAFFNKLNQAGGAAAALEGSAGFKQAWRDLATDSAFEQAVHGFIKSTHYDVLAARLTAAPGLNPDKYSMALKNVIWSVSVQHGPNSNVIQNALKNETISNLRERAIIVAVYAERSQVVVYFPNSSAAVKQSVLARFKKELALALAMLPAGE